MPNCPSVLFLDPDVTSKAALEPMLDRAFDIHCAVNTDDALATLANEWIQVLVCHQTLIGDSPTSFLQQVRKNWPDTIPIILVEPDLTMALPDPNDMPFIFNQVAKPWCEKELRLVLNGAIEHFQLQRQNEQLNIELKLRPESLTAELDERRRLLQSRFDWDQGIVRTGNSSMNQVCETIHHVAPFDVNVVISGESGTGKELCALALHNNSLRQDAPFEAENCGALPDELLESELFGHKRGAFTGAVDDRIGLFERANGGTLFLDEIGETSAAFQVKLLRVLQEGEIRPLGTNDRRTVDVRVITATNKDLEQEVQAGRFRRDLYYRLATFSLRLPPLRERRMDIPALAYSILEDAMQQLGKKVRGFTSDAIACMEAYHWPGNVRELQNEVKRMLVLAHKDKLEADLLSAKVQLSTRDQAVQPKASVPASQHTSTATAPGMNNLHVLDGSLKDRVETLETQILRETLIKHRWNKTRAAQELGLSRVGLRNKLERYALDKVKEELAVPNSAEVSG